MKNKIIQIVVANGFIFGLDADGAIWRLSLGHNPTWALHVESPSGR